ncbi:hypothetical protein HN51_008053 [Arachis hypogaea]
MSASQRKGKSKATTSKHKREESSMSIINLMHDSSWREKNFTQQEKANQLLPANDLVKFAPVLSHLSPISLMATKRLRRTCA